MPYTPARHSYNQSTNISPSTSFSVSPFGRFIHKLIESRVHIIRKLDLRYGFHPFSGTSDCKPYNTLLAQWRIKDPLGPEVPGEIHTATKNAAKSDIFAKDKNAFVRAKRLREGANYGLKEILTDRRGILGQEKGGFDGRRGMMEERVDEYSIGRLRRPVGV